MDVIDGKDLKVRESVKHVVVNLVRIVLHCQVEDSFTLMITLSNYIIHLLGDFVCHLIQLDNGRSES